MKPGTVFKWNNFPYPKFGGKIKARWFIYLGDTGLLSSPIIAHLCTTTTTLEDFKPGGKRATHRFFSFTKVKYPFFDQDCILDYEEEPYPEDKKSLLTNTNIEMKGELDKACLKTIYHGIWKSSYYPPKIVQDIHSNLNQIGIAGLKKP